jgi:hypothetical protein
MEGAAKRVTWSSDLRQVRSISPRGGREATDAARGPHRPDRKNTKPQTNGQIFGLVEHKSRGLRRSESGKQEQKTGPNASMVCLRLLSQSTKALVVQAQVIPRAV